MEELTHLKTVERPKVIQRIATARDFGDLRENAEYAAAKERQGFLETKIMDLEDKLAKAEVIDDEEIRTDKAYFGARVTLKDLKTGETLQYTLASAGEADFREGKISIESPVGKGLLGKAVGEIAEIAVPAGILTYQILNISRE